MTLKVARAGTGLNKLRLLAQPVGCWRQTRKMSHSRFKLWSHSTVYLLSVVVVT